MEATVKNSNNLNKIAGVVNSGRTDGTYFYVNGNSVTVSNPHYAMSEEQQKSELQWFLNGIEFNLSNK